MYQAHQTWWFGVGFVVCAAVVATLAALSRVGRVKLPNYVFIPPFVLAFLLIWTMNWLRVTDEGRLRGEIMGFNPLEVSNLVVSAGTARRRVSETNAVIALFGQLHQVKPVAAHHSSPTARVSIEFWSRRQKYGYQVARDSQRTNEYWVLETERAGNPGREIGRIQSPELGQVLNALANSLPLPQL